jgi:hypothetical protein
MRRRLAASLVALTCIALPPASYRRVAGRFFVFSDARGDLILYRRCNFTGTAIHCFDVRYPRDAKRAFDATVTRMSYSLAPR